jgi:hypothetical protein
VPVISPQYANDLQYLECNEIVNARGRCYNKGGKSAQRGDDFDAKRQLVVNNSR